MIRIATPLVLGLLLTSSADAAERARVDVLSWPRMRADQFGCYLEKTFGYRDARFNCALEGYRNAGDPCTNTDAYYEGPKFPESKAARIHPLVKTVELAFEHGRLQHVTLELKGRLSEDEVKGMFWGNARTKHGGLQRSSIQACGADSTCLLLQGFDHAGAGDVDCHAVKSP